MASSRHSSDSSSPTPTSTTGKTSYSWTVADILIATILGLVSGLVFWLYDGPGAAWWDSFNAITPGLAGLTVGPWLIAGTLGGIVIRKPGAALYCELIGACLEAALGSQWAIGTVYSGLAQGIGAEIVFAIFFYKRFGLGVVSLAGALAGAGAWVLEYFEYNTAKSFQFNATYFVTLLISGAVFAGILVFYIVRALVQTGALDKVRAGRANQQLV